MSAEIIRRYFAAFNAGDWAAMAGLCTDDVIHDLNQGGREIGRDRFEAFLARMARSYRERIDALVILGSDEGRFAAEWVVQGEYLADDAGLPPAHGQRYSLPGGTFFALDGDRIARITTYYNLQDWLRQVGQVESA